MKNVKTNQPNHPEDEKREGEKKIFKLKTNSKPI